MMIKKKATKKNSYGASQIKVLEGLEAVRKRPGMYIGSTSSVGLHHLVYEVVDNSIDEALAGFCSSIEVTIHEDDSITVVDNGRGIPVDMHESGMPAVEVVLTVLHAGGKFSDEGYKVSGGLHGVGVSVVNALSTEMVVTVDRDGKHQDIKFEKGVTSQKLRMLGKSNSTGTEIWFKPDPEIFEDTHYDFDTLHDRLKELAFLNKGLRITLSDERTDRTESLHFEGGIASYVKDLSSSLKQEHIVSTPLYFSGKSTMMVEKKKHPVQVEICLQYNLSEKTEIHSFVNNINTHEGGEHVIGFKTSLTKILNRYGKDLGVLKPNMTISGDDSIEGLIAVISLKMYSPIFEGQTKTKLGNKAVRGIVSTIVTESLEEIFDGNKAMTKRILDRAILAQRAREAARTAREVTRKSIELKTTSFALPGKLADCSSKDAEQSEIYLVEGDSAGGSAKQGRDRRFQAILPLRGKILNVEKARLDKLLANEEIRTMITAFGVGIGDTFDISTARYGKIIIMTDADVDGAHIRTLLLTFFYRYMRPLIEFGKVYIAQPPLYQIRKGRQHWYTYSDDEQNSKLDEVGRDGVVVQRYKGLGEMNPEQLWETTMNPETRTVLRVNLEEAEVADEIFSVLMGDKVEPRRDFIEEHARLVQNLDI